MQITIVIDRSGSMSGRRMDVIGGFNSFLEEQKVQRNDYNLNVVQFDDQYDVIVRNKNILEVQPLTESTYVPRGSTALLDAIGKAIKFTEEYDEDKKVMFVIITDGEENSSKEYSKAWIKDLIKAKEDLGWQFIYMGANQDAFAEASNIGLSAASAVNFSEEKTSGVFSRGLSYVATTYTKGMSVNNDVLCSVINNIGPDSNGIAIGVGNTESINKLYVTPTTVSTKIFTNKGNK